MAPTLVGWVVFANDLGPPQMHRLEQLSAIPINARVLLRGQGDGWTSGEHGPDDAAIAGFVDARIGDGAPGRGSTRRAAPPSLWRGRCRA